MHRAEDEYILEKDSAARELDEKKVELRENLISELEEKKRHVETERITIELTGDSMEVKAPTTRKLRRRPNDPITSASSQSDKRRKMAPAQLAYLLDESEVNEDLRAITRGGTGTSTGNGASSYNRNSGAGNKRAANSYNSPARHSDQSPSRYLLKMYFFSLNFILSNSYCAHFFLTDLLFTAQTTVTLRGTVQVIARPITKLESRMANSFTRRDGIHNLLCIHLN